MYLLRGTGVPNVFLRGGYVQESGPEGLTVAVKDIEALFVELAVEVASRTSTLTAGEFRFLRKRLGLSQSGVARRFGKEAQAVAKWEKGSASIPRAEEEALRIFLLSALAPTRVLSRVEAWLHHDHREPSRPYLLVHARDRWVAVRESTAYTGPSSSSGVVAGAGWFDDINSAGVMRLDQSNVLSPGIELIDGLGKSQVLLSGDGLSKGVVKVNMLEMGDGR
jgi:putative transcriptional regulator